MLAVSAIKPATMFPAGIETNNITEDGKGYSEPIADNTSEAGRAKNRRVEIFITNDEY